MMAFFHWLTLLFIGLKLTGYIDWSWWFVLSPTMILALLTLALFGAAVWANT